jgi:hypothetical protein
LPDGCLAGYKRTLKPHRWNVEFNGRIYHEVPLGAHGRRKHAEVETGHIRGLVKFFKIPKECYGQFVNLH